VLLFVIVIDAAMPVCPTVTEVGNVGPTDRIAPAATGLDGRTPMPSTTATTATVIANHLRLDIACPIAIAPSTPDFARAIVTGRTVAPDRVNAR
jgi:hypothetical protein